MLSVAIALLTACNGKTENKDGEQNDTIISLVPDTALYGTVGEGTTARIILPKEGQNRENTVS